MSLRSLVRAELTEEDFDIFCDVWARTRFPWFWHKGPDNRDGDLMWELVDLRSMGAYADVRMLQTMAGQDGCSVGGWMRHYRWVSPKWSDGRLI